MQPGSEHILNEARSPISERELLTLKFLPFEAVSLIAGQLSPGQRGRTAAFCYGKSHLHELGLAVAACCSTGELVEAFGRNARIVEAQARAAAQQRVRKTEPRRANLSSLAGPGFGLAKGRA